MTKRIPNLARFGESSRRRGRDQVYARNGTTFGSVKEEIGSRKKADRKQGAAARKKREKRRKRRRNGKGKAREDGSAMAQEWRKKTSRASQEKRRQAHAL